MLNITTKKLELDVDLKERLNIICDMLHTTMTIEHGSIRSIDMTNIRYIEPHKIIINNITLLAFNYSTDIYINVLTHKVKISELTKILKNS